MNEDNNSKEEIKPTFYGTDRGKIMIRMPHNSSRTTRNIVYLCSQILKMENNQEIKDKINLIIKESEKNDEITDLAYSEIKKLEGF